MPRLFVPLRRDEFEQLAQRAQLERRRPQDEAAVIIVRDLARRSPDPSGTGEPRPAEPCPD